MITELRLKNWKSFSNATLYIDPVTILIGTNASGKSNTLDALLFLQRIASGVGVYQAIHGDVNLPPIRGGMEWVCRRPSNIFSLEIILNTIDKDVEYRYTLSVQVNGIKAEVCEEELTLLKYGPRSQKAKESRLYYTQQQGNSTPGIFAYFSTGTKGPGKRIELSRSYSVLAQAESLSLRKEVQEGIREIISQLQKIFVFDPVPSHMRDYTPFSEILKPDGSNMAGVLAALEPSRKKDVEETLTRYLRKLPEGDIQRIWTEPVGKFETDAMLYCEEKWFEEQIDLFGAGNSPSLDTHIVDARGMSDGTLRFLAIVTAMLTRQPGSLLVIEEVDNGLHPSRAHILIEMLKELGNKRSIDVIVTTHNPAVLDAAGVSMVPFITVVHRDETNGASQLTLLEDLRQLPKLMAYGTLGRLSMEGQLEMAVREGAGE
ncbi:MAG: AAA family ATPase [Desulfobulbaceae bacterium]|nr:AAA family ATPase [Desulfobulbaceae bacterium]